ncbi:MAG: hypothetical protein ACI9DC_002529 [Gammaproteobacteria bacterium]
MFAIDISACPRWGGKVRVITAITRVMLFGRIREHRFSQAFPGPAAIAFWHV